MTSKSTTTPAPLSPEERRLLGVGADIGEQQLRAIMGQTDFQNILSSLLPGLIQGIGGDLGLGMAPGNAPQIENPDQNQRLASERERLERQGQELANTVDVKNSGEVNDQLRRIRERINQIDQSLGSTGATTGSALQGGGRFGGVMQQLLGQQGGMFGGNRMFAGGSQNFNEMGPLLQGRTPAGGSPTGDPNRMFPGGSQTFNEMGPLLGSAQQPGDIDAELRQMQLDRLRGGVTPRSGIEQQLQQQQLQQLSGGISGPSDIENQIQQMQLARLQGGITPRSGIEQQLQQQQLQQLSREPSGPSDIENQLQQLQLGQLTGGGVATPQDLDRINRTFGAQFESGASDIQNQFQNVLSSLRQELAPQLGLRPDDSPILDRGGRAGTEALRQIGQLRTGLAGQAAQTELQFPLQRALQMAGATGQARQGELGARAFQEQLAQQRFGNVTGARGFEQELRGFDEQALNQMFANQMGARQAELGTRAFQEQLAQQLFGNLTGARGFEQGLRGFDEQSLNQMFANQMGTRGFEQGLKEFQQGLKQQAFANRAGLVQTIGSFGLGLAGQGPSALPNVGQGSTTTTKDPFGAAAGLGSAAYGIGTLFPPSSRRFKTNGKPIDPARILKAIKTLPVERWTYHNDDREHIGPYAEDFKEAFGVGDGVTINVLDAIGVLMAAVKALQEEPHAV